MINYLEKAVYTYDDLVDILRILRAPGGCPWDREQTHESNRRNFLEEAYEAAEAFDLDDPELMKEELGDVLMQVLFNIHMEEEAGRFTTDDVTDHVVRKLIFRHPHVFSNTRADDSEQVLVNWDKLKRQEKGQQTTADAMDAVARSLPALWRADKLQSKAARAGFEFADISGALDKLDEETRELREAVERGTNFSEELGDVVQYAVLVHMLAQVSGLVPGELVHVIADAHIYDRHVPIIEKMLAQTPSPAPVFRMDPSVTDFYAFTRDSFSLEDYIPAPFEDQIPIAI